MAKAVEQQYNLTNGVELGLGPDLGPGLILFETFQLNLQLTQIMPQPTSFHIDTGRVTKWPILQS